MIENVQSLQRLIQGQSSTPNGSYNSCRETISCMTHFCMVNLTCIHWLWERDWCPSSHPSLECSAWLSAMLAKHHSHCYLIDLVMPEVYEYPSLECPGWGSWGWEVGQPLHELCYLAFLHYLQPAHDEGTLSSGIPGENFLWVCGQQNVNYM